MLCNAYYSGDVYLIPNIYLGNIFPAVFCPPVLERQWNKYLNQHAVRDFENLAQWAVSRSKTSYFWDVMLYLEHKRQQAIQWGMSNHCYNNCLQCDIIKLALTNLICIGSRSLSHTHTLHHSLSISFPPLSVPFQNIYCWC